MTTPVIASNQALSKLGTRSTISSLNEASPEARQCNLNFDSVRDDLLRQAPWDFAKKFLPGVVLKTAPNGVVPWNPNTSPPPPWKYTYWYPNDCLQVRWIQGQEMYGDAGVPIFGPNTQYSASTVSRNNHWSKGSDTIDNTPQTVIWTNVKDAIICYTRIVAEVHLWDSLFSGAFECALASRICVALTGKGQMAAELAKECMAYVQQARIVDGNEGLTVYDNEVDWIMARGIDEDTWGHTRW